MMWMLIGMWIGFAFCLSRHKPTLTQVLPADRTCEEYMDTFVEQGQAPVETIPRIMLREFTLWNETMLKYWFRSEVYAGREAMVSTWSRRMVDGMIQDVYRGNPACNYDDDVFTGVLPSLLAFPVHGKRGCVIGSESPWLEAVLLARGAAHVTTIEYGEIVTDHPQLTTLTPAQVRDGYTAMDKFDFVYSYSSLEHSGLGRYGDRLDPFGDLQMIARIACMLKPRGIFYFGVPTSDTDCLEFNVHRIYGPVRLGIIEQQLGWTIEDRFGQVGKGCEWSKQSVHVMRRQPPKTSD